MTRSSDIDEILRGLIQAFQLIVTRDAAVMEIVSLSLRVSGIALLFSTLIGVPLGATLGLSRFIGRRLVVALLYTGMGFPPVVVGLFVYLMLSRSGPLGSLGWPSIPSFFTPAAMVTAQCIISFPLVAGFTMAAVMGVDPQLRQQVRALAHRVGLLLEGRIVEVAEETAFFESPRDPRTAAFVRGEMVY